MKYVFFFFICATCLLADMQVGYERTTGHLDNGADGHVSRMDRVYSPACVLGPTGNRPNGTNLFDVFGQGINGWASNANTTATWTSNGMSFGGNDMFIVDDNAALKPTNNFTITAWVRTYYDSGANIFQSYNYSADKGLLFGKRTSANNNAIQVQCNDGTAGLINGATNIADGDWHFVAWVHTNGGLTNYVYVDARLDATGPTRLSASYNVVNYIRVGALKYDTGTVQGSYWSGMVSRLSVFNRPLGSNEVEKLRAATFKSIYKGKYTTNLNPFNSVYGLTSIWTTCVGSGQEVVNRFDPDNGASVATIPLGAGSMPNFMAVVGSNLWVTMRGSNAVARINPVNNTVLDFIAVSNGPRGIITDQTNVYVAAYDGFCVNKIDTSTRAITASMVFASNTVRPFYMSFDNSGYLWVSDQTSTAYLVYRTDTAAMTNLPIFAGKQPWGLRQWGSNMMVSCYASNTVVALDPENGSVVSAVPLVPAPAEGVGNNLGPHEMAIVDDALWVACSVPRRVQILNRWKVVDSLRTGNDPASVIYVKTNDVWVTSLLDSQLWRYNKNP